MKKMMILAMVAVCGIMASCNKTNVATTEDKPAAENSGISAWALSQQLAAYGYENESASALVEAANILLDVVVTEAEGIVSDEKGAANPDEQVKVEKPAITVDALLASAIEFGADEAAVEAVRTRQAQIAEMGEGATRGAVGGAHTITDVVAAHSYEQYYCNFRAHEQAIVVVSGDGDTDLDLYIYDENHNLIDSDTDLSDQCVCSFTPSWTGRFYMKVVNRGNVYNRFVLATN